MSGRVDALMRLLPDRSGVIAHAECAVRAAVVGPTDANGRLGLQILTDHALSSNRAMTDDVRHLEASIGATIAAHTRPISLGT